MSKNINVPQLRFSEFSGEWEEKKLLELSENGFSNGAFNDPKKVGYGYRIINVKDMYIDGTININTLSKVGLDEKEFLNNRVEYGDIFFTRSSLVKEGIAHSNINLTDVDDLTFDGHLIRMRPKKQECSPMFLYYNFITSHARKQFIIRGKTTTMTTIGQEDIASVNIILPSKQEQEKIASFLTSVDTKIEQLTKKETLLQEYKKGVMAQIFSRKIRFKDDNGSEFLEWEEKRLGEIGRFQTSSIDKLSKKDEKEVFLINYMDVYRHKNINNQTIKNFQVVTAKDSQIESCNLILGDILFTPSSETPDDIGHSVVIFEDLDNAVFSYHLMRFRPSITIDILYSHYFCNIPSVLNQLAKFATGSTRFTISVKSFSSVTIQLPCLKEQTKIANFLSSIDTKIELVQRELEKTKEFKKALLQQMFV